MGGRMEKYLFIQTNTAHSINHPSAILQHRTHTHIHTLQWLLMSFFLECLLKKKYYYQGHLSKLFLKNTICGFS